MSAIKSNFCAKVNKACQFEYNAKRCVASQYTAWNSFFNLATQIWHYYHGRGSVGLLGTGGAGLPRIDAPVADGGRVASGGGDVAGGGGGVTLLF